VYEIALLSSNWRLPKVDGGVAWHLQRALALKKALALERVLVPTWYSGSFHQAVHGETDSSPMAGSVLAVLMLDLAFHRDSAVS
jgi:hypothetical protein